MIVDTSALLAFFDAHEPDHALVVASIVGSDEPLVVSPLVLAELDHLVLTRHGSAAEVEVLAELSGGAWELALMNRRRLAEATELVRRYSDIPIGVTDAANIVLAEAYQTRTIATLDRRHFSVLRLADGSAPTIVP